VDGDTGNSPYAAALARAIVEPGRKVEDAFKDVRRYVRAATGDRQTPTETTELTEDFYFVPSKTNASGGAQGGTEPDTAPSTELAFWNSISQARREELEAYLQQYPSGTFAALARMRIASLEVGLEQSESKPTQLSMPVSPGINAELISAAKAEGQLTVIALPHDWCGYGEIIEAFKSKYGLTVNELNPDAGSGDEIEAIKANKENTGPQAPDVIDVGIQFAVSAKAEGLIQPYKVAAWDSIPGSAKDADGYRKEEIVFHQGDAADALFYIKEGRCKVTVVSKQGKLARNARVEEDLSSASLAPSVCESQVWLGCRCAQQDTLG
jgi:hypothetical protein